MIVKTNNNLKFFWCSLFYFFNKHPGLTKHPVRANTPKSFFLSALVSYGCLLVMVVNAEFFNFIISAITITS